jgi:alanyl-tRNA synthetase
MPKVSLQALREQFLAFFAARGHQVVASSSLVPAADPSLLFTNAGMVQFKDLFLGLQSPASVGYTCATTCQRCVRAGGKHNDLEQVGFTARHHTFFEMLGNFSFGAYFKREAIQYAWEFLTKVLALPVERLYVSVYQDDLEAAKIWLEEIGLAPQHLGYCGKASNFWAMGDTGPCGPCTEIFYDKGAQFIGSPPGYGDEGERFVEIWNLVFMQYNAKADGSLEALPKPAVDTGMGLERLLAVMQGVESNYDTDMFVALIGAIAALTQTSDLSHTSLRVLADHIRSTVFLIADGVSPSNEGRGYVLRRILRRAIRHGHKLGMRTSFFYQLVPTVVELMGAASAGYMQEKVSFIMQTIEQEEQQFALTLEQGLKILQTMLAEPLAQRSQVFSGLDAFKLYDTYGFPLDLTASIVQEQGLQVDVAAFEAAMQQQKTRARSGQKFATQSCSAALQDLALPTTCFTGYQSLVTESELRVILLSDGSIVPALPSCSAPQELSLILDTTPFYGEAGGQVGDTGQLYRGATLLAEVLDTKIVQGQVVHIVTLLAGQAIQVGDTLRAVVDGARRGSLQRNHSATHLLHAALRQIIGNTVEQRGSVVTAERLRLDIACPRALTPEEIQAVEQLVQAQIAANTPVITELMSIENARARGAMALFGEKYGQEVRVLSMGDGFSQELCGGTHVRATGDIGCFKIVSEASIAAGVRRIEAVTATEALQAWQQQQQQLQGLAQFLKTDASQLLARVQQLIAEQQQLKQQYEALEQRLLQQQLEQLLTQASMLGDIKVLQALLPVTEVRQLRFALDYIKQRWQQQPRWIVLLALQAAEKAQLLLAVSPACLSICPATELIVPLAAHLGGKGGGKPELAQAGGNATGLAAALGQLQALILERVAP